MHPLRYVLLAAGLVTLVVCKTEIDVEGGTVNINSGRNVLQSGGSGRRRDLQASRNLGARSGAGSLRRSGLFIRYSSWKL